MYMFKILYINIENSYKMTRRKIVRTLEEKKEFLQQYREKRRENQRHRHRHRK